jgi:hypothetical protein
MQTFRFSCCERIDYPDNPDYHGEIVVIAGLITPPTSASGRGEALALLHDWFIANKCRPFQEVS